MSDNEEQVYQEEEDVTVEVAADTAAPGGGISIEDALKGVLRRALVSDGLARGLREATKAISCGQAQLVVLCDSCTEEQYVKLIEALCNEPQQKIPLIKVADAKKIGEWAGLCQIDREGAPRKIVGCSCAVIRDWGEESEERSVILQNFSQ